MWMLEIDSLSFMNELHLDESLFSVFLEATQNFKRTLIYQSKHFRAYFLCWFCEIVEKMERVGKTINQIDCNCDVVYSQEIPMILMILK